MVVRRGPHTWGWSIAGTPSTCAAWREYWDHVDKLHPTLRNSLLLRHAQHVRLVEPAPPSLDGACSPHGWWTAAQLEDILYGSQYEEQDGPDDPSWDLWMPASVTSGATKSHLTSVKSLPCIKAFERTKRGVLRPPLGQSKVLRPGTYVAPGKLILHIPPLLSWLPSRIGLCSHRRKCYARTTELVLILLFFSLEFLSFDLWRLALSHETQQCLYVVHQLFQWNVE